MTAEGTSFSGSMNTSVTSDIQCLRKTLTYLLIYSAQMTSVNAHNFKRSSILRPVCIQSAMLPYTCVTHHLGRISGRCL